jgi:hypothetical protein
MAIVKKSQDKKSFFCLKKTDEKVVGYRRKKLQEKKKGKYPVGEIVLFFS